MALTSLELLDNIRTKAVARLKTTALPLTLAIHPPFMVEVIRFSPLLLLL